MKINTKVRYGLKALAYIAENSSDKKLVRIKEISEDQDISIQYLEQILFKLKNENIIEGKRGPTGGYKLTLKPNQINLYTIYKILDDEERVIDSAFEISDNLFVDDGIKIYNDLKEKIEENIKYNDDGEEYIKKVDINAMYDKMNFNIEKAEKRIAEIKKENGLSNEQELEYN